MFTSEKVEDAKCSTGLEQNISILLIYLFTPLGGLFFHLIEKENKFVRFSAMQSLLIMGVWLGALFTFSLLSMIPFLGILFTLFTVLLWVGLLAVIIVLIVQGFQNIKMKLPIIGDLAEQWSEAPSE